MEKRFRLGRLTSFEDFSDALDVCEVRFIYYQQLHQSNTYFKLLFQDFSRHPDLSKAMQAILAVGNPGPDSIMHLIDVLTIARKFRDFYFLNCI